MSVPTTLNAPRVVAPARQAKGSEYSLTHVFAMPVAFVAILLLMRLAAG